MKYHINLAEQKHIWAGVITVVSLCVQYTTVLMSQDAAAATEKAYWNDAEVDALLAFLSDHCAEGGDSGSFKMGTFNAASQSIAALKTTGPLKTGKMCKTKWISVRSILSQSDYVTDKMIFS